MGRETDNGRESFTLPVENGKEARSGLGALPLLREGEERVAEEQGLPSAQSSERHVLENGGNDEFPARPTQEVPVSLVRLLSILRDRATSVLERERNAEHNPTLQSAAAVVARDGGAHRLCRPVRRIRQRNERILSGARHTRPTDRQRLLRRKYVQLNTCTVRD